MDTKFSKNGKKTILHITPHLGGGVGSVLLNYLAAVRNHPDFIHQVYSLEYANDRAIQASVNTGFLLRDKMSGNHASLLDAVSRADIVLIHWWNHPLLYDLLVREKLPESRVIFWSHISGFHPPYVFPPAALQYPDLFIFTSPLSMNIEEVQSLLATQKQKLRVIWSTGGISEAARVKPVKHSGFNIGYIGTVDYGKLHPHFLNMCSKVKIPDVRFIVCGGPSEKIIQEESKRYGKEHQVIFTGPINNVEHYLSQFDVFGYPLSPFHYGTCEQVLGESMAAGVPPVVLNNPTESLIVEHSVTGLIASDEDSYVSALEELYFNPSLRKTLSENAGKAAAERYSLERMIACWQKAYSDVLSCPKTPKKWMGRFHGKSVDAAHLFIESLGHNAGSFINYLEAQSSEEQKNAASSIRILFGSSPLWQATTRGTPNHYATFFPEDRHLKVWKKMICN